MKNRNEVRHRISRLNRYILVFALLWIVIGLALLFAARHDLVHATQHQNPKPVQMAALIGLSS